MPGLVDTHCHLDAAEFDIDRDDTVETAHRAGVTAIVVPAVSRRSFSNVIATCRHHTACVPAFGIHPLYVAQAEPTDLEALRSALVETPAAAVGEIGLDFFVENPDRERQTQFFAEQLKIARELDLPVILHVRRAVDAVLKELRQTRVRGGIAHAFNGSHQQAEMLIDLGFKLGFGGAMTYDRALRIRELASTLPLDAIVLETDSPDMPPAWLAHGRNAPAELPRIAEELARLRNSDVSEIAAATSRNAVAVLPVLASVCQA